MSGAMSCARALARLAVITGALAFAACRDGLQPRVESASLITVSDPVPDVPSLRQGSIQSSPGSAGTDAAYVSLPPGAIPGGTQATIRVSRTASSMTVAMRDGGFDPVPVIAAPDDTLDIDVRDAGGMSLMATTTTVPRARRPSVVRTEPTAGHRDIPLNSIIVVVFSEPIDPRTADAGTIRLLAAGVPVSGRAVVALDGFRVEFQPDRPLPGRTECILAVGGGVADLEGDTLAGPVYVPFATDSAVGVVASVVVSPPTLVLAPGDSSRMVAGAYDSTGNLLSGQAVTWASDDTSVARVTTSGVVSARAVGSTMVTATVGAVSGSATINVSLNPPRILIDASHDGGVWWFPQAGTFDPDQPHQGKALADYLRAQGFTVDELPRGVVIGDAILDRYTRVIRAGLCVANDPFDQSQLDAYARFLTRTVTLLIFGDHLNVPECGPDALVEMLGIHPAGIQNGTVATFAPHPLTAGVTTVPYIAGSVMTSYDTSRVDIIGWLDNGAPAMAVVRHPTAKIFFLSDLNGVEGLPQPFVDNLIAWGF
jgi:Big-like domain-containing protein